jgi:3-hydroxybutyryl-CoA dehydrogenase
MAERVCVIGAGLMGHALALDFAARGQHVRITDTHEQQLATVHQRIAADAQPLIQAGVLDATVSLTSLVTPVANLAEAVRGATYIVEAVPERLDIKRVVLAQLEQAAAADAIFASNTSGLRATDLAAGLLHPERVIVAHYFNPPHLIPAVEIVPGEQTSPETVARTVGLLRSIGKLPVALKREVPGFIANRLQAALLREAVALVESGVATTEDIDVILHGAVGRRLSVMGPFQVLDFAGLDVWADLGSYLFADLDTSDAVQRFLERHVAAGRTGVKAGAGVYTWDAATLAAVGAARNTELLRGMQRDQQRAAGPDKE